MTKVASEVFGYSSNRLLVDWWYLSDKITEHQSKLKEVNNRHTSKKLRLLYTENAREGSDTMLTLL